MSSESAVTVTVYNHTRSTRGERKLKIIAETILRAEGGVSTLDIVLAGERRSASLNKQYKGKDGVASVLTFILDKHTAQLFLCPRYIARKGHPVEYYLVHGLGHVVGLHHDSRRAGDIMLIFETNWLNHFNICHPTALD